ncbi:hypothetical protein BDP27DRAFT_1338814 [Rhodocollybia butyracea]|uniref:Uncharacterized protein n=1 Tax=Rhodocollybia butyracea TaxID=206335 RepID=A0A9P5P8Q1_9AGAR|nr:hypothetical protein BDP27DRAFT_1338814 [Rhodocollybia butyracea]
MAITKRLTDFCDRVSAGSTHENTCPPNPKYRKLCRYLNADAGEDGEDEGGENSESEGGEVSLSNQMRIFVAHAEEGICSGELPCVGYRAAIKEHTTSAIYQLKPGVTDINKLPPKLTKDAGAHTKESPAAMKQYEDKFEALLTEKLKDPAWWMNLKTSIKIEQLDEKCDARERRAKHKYYLKHDHERKKKAKMTVEEKAKYAAEKKKKAEARRKWKAAERQERKAAARRKGAAWKKEAAREKEAAARKEAEAQKAVEAAAQWENAKKNAAVPLRPLRPAPPKEGE